jgi:iron complex outermembrane receptor protein
MHRPFFWVATAGALLSAGTVAAQTTPASEGGLEEIVVTGVRQSLENAIATKRDAAAVVDAISAEDVGKFPTENLAESLQRVTGVQISRFRGEGQNVTIRGLPSEFSLVQLNGRTLTSALGASGSGLSRSFDFTILPSEFVSRVEVYKSPTADLEEGGLAGTVIARTLRPLDVAETRFGGSLQMANESNRDEWAPRASMFYSDVFADGKLGVALGVAYTERLTETHEQRITRYRRATEAAQGGLDLNGNGIVEDGKPDPPNRPADQPPHGPLNATPYAMLDSSFHTLYREDRKRKTAIATVQFKPNNEWEFVAEGFYGKVDLFSPRYTDLLRVGVNLQSGGPVIAGSNVLEQRPGNDSAVGDRGLPVNTLMAGGFRGVDQRADGRTEEREGDLLSTSLGGTYTGESFTVTTELGYSVAKQTRSDPLLENMRRTSLTYDLRTNPDLVGYSFVGADQTTRLNPSTFTLIGFNGEWGREREDEQTDLAVDVNQNFSWWWIDGLQYGGKYTIRENYENNRRITATEAQLRPLWGGGPAPDLFLKEVRPSSGEFLDADGGTSGLFHQSWLVNDPFAFIKAYGRKAIEAVSTITNDPTGINDVEEDVSALYVRANIDRGGKLTGNIGVRAVYTQQKSVGVAPDLTAITVDTQGTVTRVPAGAPLTADRNYTDILPSLNLKYELTDDVALRFAASRTMSRPSLSQISPSVTASGATQTLTANNPELDPFRSNNFDFSAEWYFSRGALLAGTVFYKDIVSLVERQQTQIPLTITQINGDVRTPVNQLWTRSQLVNGKGTAVAGVEASYQQNFDFLPAPFDGFGVLTNYTYMDTHGGTPLQGASKNNYTASMYYEKGWFGGRVSYTWRDDFYTGVEANTQDTRIQQDFGTLDANISFNFNDHVSAVVEATNILEEVDQDRFMPIDLIGFYTDNGRRILVGLRGSF